MVKRKRFTPEEKISILREYLEYQIPIDQLEHKYGIKRNLIHSWKLKLFRDGLEIFSISSKNNNHTAETHQGAQTDEYDMLFESIEKIRSKIQETNKLINDIGINLVVIENSNQLVSSLNSVKSKKEAFQAFSEYIEQFSKRLSNLDLIKANYSKLKSKLNELEEVLAENLTLNN